MGVLGLFFGALEGVAVLVSATRRLCKAEREIDAAETSAPVVPPPPDPQREAVAYVRGRDDATRAREQQERAKAALDEFAKRAAMAEDAREAEKPTEGS